MILTSCGVVITDGENILLGKINGDDEWDIPKGLMDDGESYIDAALRELQEESNLVLDKGLLEVLGFFPYNPRKQLCLYRVKYKDLYEELDTKKMYCSSMVAPGWPEISYWDIKQYDDVDFFCNERLAIVLKQVREM